MPESAFLNAIAAYLAGPAGLSPAPVSVGAVEPVAEAEAPALVLSLDQVHRLDGGIGGGFEAMSGILAVTSTIDLASPFLVGEPTFSLLSGDRLVLTLPHGGLIRADGLASALGPDDIQVAVAGVGRSLTAPPPQGQAFSVDAVSGQLTFGTALPETGKIIASYHLGQWERQVRRIAGVMRLDVRAADAAIVNQLGTAAMRALDIASGGAVSSLRKLIPISLGVVGPPDPLRGATRGRSAVFAFEFDHVVDAPASSGGIIDRIPITTTLTLVSTDAASGAEVLTTVVEND